MKRADWLGPIGGLLPIEGSSSIGVERPEAYSLVNTVENVRRAFRPSRPPLRTWAMSEPNMGASSVATLNGFADGLYGRGPWAWIPGNASVSSVLTPAQSALVNVGREFSAAGPVVVDGETLPASVFADIPSGWRGLVDAPVVPGQPVTASIWVQSTKGDPIISVGWIFGDQIPSTESVTGSGIGMWQRLSWTGVAPPGATQIRLGVRSSVTAAAGPQVSWTPSAVGYAAGSAASEVILQPPKITPRGTWKGSFLYDVEYTVEEVGHAGW